MENFSKFVEFFNFISSRPFFILPFLLLLISILFSAIKRSFFDISSYADDFDKIEISNNEIEISNNEIEISNNEIQIPNNEIKIPMHCVNCGALLNNNVCEYCGTIYD